MVTSGVGRVATWIAVGVLVLNTLLLGAAGLVAGRLVLVGAAGLSLLGAFAVVVAWRRHLRTLDELTAARAALRDEALALRELVKGDRT
ncbi:MAG: hypothetical protein ABR551_05135 [Gemmatimonadales bacterium]